MAEWCLLHLLESIWDCCSCPYCLLLDMLFSSPRNYFYDKAGCSQHRQVPQCNICPCRTSQAGKPRLGRKISELQVVALSLLKIIIKKEQIKIKTSLEAAGAGGVSGQSWCSPKPAVGSISGSDGRRRKRSLSCG